MPIEEWNYDSATRARISSSVEPSPWSDIS
jgi:hypothetical protein